MSTLDQAFLRAYCRTETAAPVAPAADDLSAPTTKVITPHSQRATPSPRAAALASMAEYKVESAPRVHAPDAHSHVPPPHADFSVAHSPSTAPAITSATERGIITPALEVRRFHWPSVVGAVIADLLGELSETAQELAERSRQGRRLIVLTGVRRGEGRSTLLMVLARTAAAHGLRVAMVDADFRRPRLAEQLGIAVPVGWEDVIAGKILLEEALVESVEERITLLPLRGRTDHESSLGIGGEAGRSLSRLREAYDVVLLDAGPLESDQAAVDEAAVLHNAPIDDCLVVRDATLIAQSINIMERRLHAIGIRRWEIVENFT